MCSEFDRKQCFFFYKVIRKFFKNYDKISEVHNEKIALRLNVWLLTKSDVLYPKVYLWRHWSRSFLLLKKIIFKSPIIKKMRRSFNVTLNALFSQARPQGQKP